MKCLLNIPNGHLQISDRSCRCGSIRELFSMLVAGDASRIGSLLLRICCMSVACWIFFPFGSTERLRTGWYSMLFSLVLHIFRALSKSVSMNRLNVE